MYIQFQKLGLSNNESLILEYLFKLGESNSKSIQLQLNLDKSSVFASLNSLRNKGYIYSIGESRNQKYCAYSPNKVLQEFEKEQNKLDNAKNEFQEFIEEIKNSSKNALYKNRVKIYEGEDSFRKWAYDRLSSPKGSTIRKISSFEKQKKNSDDYVSYSKRIIKERLSKEIKMIQLVDQDSIDNFEIKSTERTDPKLLKITKIIPSELNIELDTSLITYGNSVGFYQNISDEPWGIVIEDRLIKKTIDSYFDLISSLCTEI